MLILSVDTSCDETSAAITNKLRVLSNVVASQVDLHQKWGGVVPSIAKRAHQENLAPVVKEALFQAGLGGAEIEAIAVTYGPGLAIALEVGIKKARELAQRMKVPLIAVDHMEAHLLSAFAQDEKGNFGIKNPKFPALGLLVSGGHTELVLMGDYGEYQLIGQTLDDAVGECFDKVAKVLGLGYPGGPEISQQAAKGDSAAYRLPVPMRSSADFNYSYSGLKTAAKLKVEEEKIVHSKKIPDFCASFEKAVIKSLLIKLVKAVEEFSPKMILLGGGVISSQKIQAAVKEEMGRYNIPVYLPFSRSLLTDNAAMVGIAAHFKAQKNDFVKEIESLDRFPGLEISERRYQ